MKRKRIKGSAVLGLLITLFSQVVNAQQDTTSVVPEKLWKFDGTYSFNINESSFTNWVAGGNNQVGLSTILKPTFVYDDKKWSWETDMDFRYGFQKNKSSKGQKSDDVLRMESKLGRRISEKWKFSGFYSINTQFSSSSSDGQLVSTFMAPAYTNLSLGFDYNPNDKISIYMTPWNLRTTYVLNDSLSAKGSFGVTPGKYVVIKMGPSFLIKYKDEFLKNFLIDTKLGVFMNVMDGIGNPVVNWDNILTMKVNKYIATTFAFNLFFDPDSKLDVKDASGQVTGKVAKVQFKQTLGVGFNYKW
jgi:hypothetical protein